MVTSPSSAPRAAARPLLQRLLLQSVLPRIGTGLDQRALIYDAKQDVLSLLAGMGLRCPIATFSSLRCPVCGVGHGR
jgi:hypothetical protein